ncbi:hypothetical protein EYF80_032225 [Liparis tanakae]|uniref:Uncharacterized protein n=1 Tax=Liparis tanakae TaxID=230148 RepID=A0A4Z2GVT0_9TELE|nr:hypothetical protein EYF80_032225 [Liparis tanakae]
MKRSCRWPDRKPTASGGVSHLLVPKVSRKRARPLGCGDEHRSGEMEVFLIEEMGGGGAELRHVALTAPRLFCCGFETMWRPGVIKNGDIGVMQQKDPVGERSMTQSNVNSLTGLYNWSTQETTTSSSEGFSRRSAPRCCYKQSSGGGISPEDHQEAGPMGKGLLEGNHMGGGGSEDGPDIREAVRKTLVD